MKFNKNEFGKNILSKVYKKIKPVLDKKININSVSGLMKSNLEGDDIYKIMTVNLRNDDPEKMYPVTFRFSNILANKSGRGIGEVIVSRDYWWDNDLNTIGDGLSRDRFSDGYGTHSHVSSLLLVLTGGDEPSGGGAFKDLFINFYAWRYMNCAQLFDTHMFRVYFQGVDDTVFNSDTDVKPTDLTSFKNGLYLRGGLQYRIGYIGLKEEPIVFRTPTLLSKNTSQNRTEWLAPFKYDPANSINMQNTPQYL